MYAATVGCQVRDTDALFMQHRKVNISTKRRRRRRCRTRSPSSWLRLRAYFSRMDNYPEGVTLRGEEESRVASLTRNLLAFDRRGFDLEPVDERSANALHYS